MLSFLVNIEENQALIQVTVGHLEDLDKVHGYRALLDTGAQSTLVSQKIIDDLKFTYWI
ncbi:MAG: hypothetical protein OXE59_06560 [Bacteroidetes bacterium]|nr:hypothetical protein [Bacteroidota bacterium]